MSAALTEIDPEGHDSLQADLDATRSKMESFARDLRVVDQEFDALAEEREQYRLLENACDALEALEGAGLTVETAEVTQMPSTTIPVAESQARQVLRIVDALEDLDDLQAVFANFDISDEVLAALVD